MEVIGTAAANLLISLFFFMLQEPAEIQRAHCDTCHTHSGLTLSNHTACDRLKVIHRYPLLFLEHQPQSGFKYAAILPRQNVTQGALDLFTLFLPADGVPSTQVGSSVSSTHNKCNCNKKKY